MIKHKIKISLASHSTIKLANNYYRR